MQRDQVRAPFDQLAEPLFTAMECIFRPFTFKPLRNAIHDADDCVNNGGFERPGREYAEYAKASVFDQQRPTGERGEPSVSGPLPFAGEGMVSTTRLAPVVPILPMSVLATRIR